MSYLSKSVCIRICLAIMYSFIFYYNEKHITFVDDDDIQASIFTGKYALLTNLNLVFLWGSLVFSLLCCGLSSNIFLQKFNGLFAGTSSAMCLLVFVLFWALYFIDRELVYPTEIDDIIPMWHNHALHTVIVPASLINYCLVPRSASPSLVAMLAGGITLGLAYVAWIHLIHSVTGWWVYPVLQLLSPVQRGIFILACAASVLPFTCAVFAFKSRLVGKCIFQAGAEKAKLYGKLSGPKGDNKRM